MLTWRKNQTKDHFYTKAKQDGYRSRASYKLLEIQGKFNLIKPRSNVLDLGCAPGGWLQVIRKQTKGLVFGIDLQKVDPIKGVCIGQFDFTDQNAVEIFLKNNNGPRYFDAILSDMSPAISGDREFDHYKSVELVECVHSFAMQNLSPGGWMVCKLFDGADTRELLEKIKKTMSVKVFKPDSSRSESREMFLVCNWDARIRTWES